MNFPPSRPATTELAKETGEALGVKVKPAGNRPLQPVVDKFFYWLRASMLETRRVAYWWADRMLNTERPLEEKMTLFWHGHFATSEDKVRDFRKMLRQNETFRRHATGDFRDLMVAVAQDPAMLYFLDAGVNVKGAPNENFAREIMELFTMGVGHYGEQDIREGARAFTGWNADELTFVVHPEQHDDGAKSWADRQLRWRRGDRHHHGAAGDRGLHRRQAYRYLVRDDLDPELQGRLGAVLRDADYQLKPLLRTLFLSRDFYSPASMGTRIKSPVELVVSTYKKLGAPAIPGIPDLNETTGAMGQALFWPPTVAGWAQGRSWITPGCCSSAATSRSRCCIRTSASCRTTGIRPTRPSSRCTSASGRATTSPARPCPRRRWRRRHDGRIQPDGRSRRGLQHALRLLSRLADGDRQGQADPRAPADIDLAAMVRAEGLTTTAQVVDYFLLRFMSVPIGTAERQMLIDFLDQQLGTSDIVRADSYLEDPLRMLTHLIMSQPEYQLG